MARKPFRIEVNYPTKGTKKCFLVRDIQVNKKRRKVRISIGSIPPENAEEMEKLRRRHGLEMSLKEPVSATYSENPPSVPYIFP